MLHICVGIFPKKLSCTQSKIHIVNFITALIHDPLHQGWQNRVSKVAIANHAIVMEAAVHSSVLYFIVVLQQNVGAITWYYVETNNTSWFSNTLITVPETFIMWRQTGLAQSSTRCLQQIRHYEREIIILGYLGGIHFKVKKGRYDNEYDAHIKNHMVFMAN